HASLFQSAVISRQLKAKKSIDSIACPVKRDPVYRDISRGIDSPGAQRRQLPTSSFQLPTVFFRKNSQLWQIAHFKQNQKHGTWIRYDRNNTVEFEGEFREGKGGVKK
ncbi:TPA: hypothetical protein DCG86_03880, partial [Candidatus Marinimicrobia bacterium]|nr:hypothetical protein [Candidatus Neomarinimicrobiota bacterium]